MGEGVHVINKPFEPADYCLCEGSPDQRLSRFERLTLTGGSDLEKALEWVAKQFESFRFPTQLGGLDLQRFSEAAAFYADERWLKNPASFFVAPTSAPTVRETLIHGLKDGVVVDLEFTSSHQPMYPGYAALRDANPENQQVHVRWWRHDSGSTGTVVAIHGWTMGDQRVNSLIFLPGILYRMGLDVALVELPFHGRRSPKAVEGAPSLFPSTDVVRTNESIAQAISDCRELLLYLRNHGAKDIGVIGMSLGGYLSALWASLDRLAFCIPIVPFASMAEVGWEVLTRSPNFAELRGQGLEFEMLESVYHLHSPLTHTLKLDRERAMIIAGIGDEIVPPRQPKLLWQHWRHPAMFWFNGGHVAQVRRAQAFGEMLGFLERLGYVKGV